MIAALQQSLEWVHHHPHWALLLLFVAALLDSIFIIGAFVPAGVALFAAGALVALGSMELWQAVLTAALGAVFGDGFSFWLGRRYGDRLFSGRLLRRYPELIANGHRFFDRYGGFSVALARFLGPMRAIVPALAGAARMRIAAFITADISSALAWAFAFVLPGVAFGASLGLAAEVAGRLALLLLALMAALALTIWLTAGIGRAAQRHAETWIGGLLDWSRRHRRLRTFGAALADPTQPETPVLALLAALLLLVSGLWLWLWAGAALHSYPTAIDAAVFQSMRDLHTPWGMALALRLLQIGHWTVYAPVALVTFVCLAGLRKPRAAAHWVAAVGFGGLLSAGLYAVPTLPPPYRFFGTALPPAHDAHDLVLATVIYAFVPALLASGRSPPVRRLLYGGSVAVLTLVVLARLYVGVQWYSVALLSVVVGVLWAGLLGLGYRRHRPERLPARKVLAPAVAAFLVAVILVWSAPPPMPDAPADSAHVVTALDWQNDAWRQLARGRIDIAGRTKQPMSLQWAGELPVISAHLEAVGWAAPPPLTLSSALRWLTRNTPVAELPILPQVHAGLHPALNLRRVRDAGSGELIRFWPSGLRLADGRPVWLASLTRVEARSLYRLLRYPVGDPTPLPPETLLADVSGLQALQHGEVWLLSLAATDDTAPPPVVD